MNAHPRVIRGLSPSRHPPEAALVDYAGGGLDAAGALVIAIHLGFCPVCRQQVATFEAACGDFLEEEEAAPLSSACLDRMMGRLDGPIVPARADVHESPGSKASLPEDGAGRIPQPLRDYLGGSLDQLSWRTVTRGVERADIAVGCAPLEVFLLRMQAGRAAPRHSHYGTEVNVVLVGHFEDERGTHAPGDLVIDDASVEHQPVACAKTGCLCLCVTNAPLRPTGGLRRLLPSFLRL